MPEFGDQSGVIRHGIRVLVEEPQRRNALGDLLRAWELDAGSVDDDAVAAMTERYFAE